MAKFNNPVAYGMSYAAQDVSKETRTAVADVEVTNGMLVTLSGLAGVTVTNPSLSTAKEYVFKAVPTTAATDVNVWMVRAPEVPMTVCANLYDDPRAFSIPAGTPFDIIHLTPNDVIKVSRTAFLAENHPDHASAGNVAKAWVVPDVNGQYKAETSASGKTGLVLKCLGLEDFVIGQDYEPGYILEVVQNPNTKLV